MEQMHSHAGPPLPFLGMPRAPVAPARHRLILAVLPDDGTQLRIAAEAWRLHNRYRLRGRPLEIGRFHLPLFALGEHAQLPERGIAAAKRAAAGVSVRSFDIGLDRVASFARPGQPQPVVMLGDGGLAGFEQLQEALGAALRAAGLPARAGTPHVTLQYDRRAVPEETIEPLGWRVQDFVLLHEHLGQDRQSLLGRWPLLGRTTLTGAAPRWHAAVKPGGTGGISAGAAAWRRQ